MSEEKFIVNDGDGAKLVPVVSKEPTISAEEFAKSTPPVVEKKKRGRRKKVVAPIEEAPTKKWYCSTCREDIDDKNVMRIGAGDNGRCAVFCPQCQRSFGFQDKDLHDKVAALIKNNPTK